MPIFKCKMCGGDLNVTENKTVIECDYCGTSQTIPTADNEKKINLFNRANRLRFNSEFDKAEALYESIISEFPEEAEAHWGLCLCKYGIEYVDDPATARKIPTCHRTSFKSIFDEESYKLAIEYADIVAQKIYRDEARAIDTLQKDILQVVNTVEPYDVFICYKETGENGQRTYDSVLAQDIYDALTEKGLKVFFSRITLEDKLGTAYEPYIFAALNSAKVMLSIGTKYEHFNAVWVKNEWSRYLDFMKIDRKRVLIPCYKDIDPYDMPEEFRNLQAQDMNKIGAMQDLVRGVLKIVQPVSVPVSMPMPIHPTTTTNIPPVSASLESLLKRAYIFLKDANWESANEYCEKVLDIDPECAEAYLGKMMADLKLRTMDDIDTCKAPIMYRDEYSKVVEYAKGPFRMEISRRFEHAQQARNDTIYADACNLASAGGITNLQNAMDLFTAIRDWKDSAQLYQQCSEAIEKINENERIRQRNMERDAVAATVQQMKMDIAVAESNLNNLQSGANKFRPFVWLFVFLFAVFAYVAGVTVVATGGNSGNNDMLVFGIVLAMVGVVCYMVAGIASTAKVIGNKGAAVALSIFVSAVCLVMIFVALARDVKARNAQVHQMKFALGNMKNILAQYEEQLRAYGG